MCRVYPEPLPKAHGRHICTCNIFLTHTCM
jgi:hypothetical protein